MFLFKKFFNFLQVQERKELDGTSNEINKNCCFLLEDLFERNLAHRSLKRLIYMLLG